MFPPSAVYSFKYSYSAAINYYYLIFDIYVTFL